MNFSEGKKAFAIERFDRTNKGRRVHMEDFAQVYNIYPDKKYEGVSYTNIANMVWSLTGEKGIEEFIKRLTFSILIGNGDMHLKNWSFLYKDGVTPSLSPAYDLVSTIPYIPNDGLALKLSGTTDTTSINIKHFKQLVDEAKLPEHLILETVKRTSNLTKELWNSNQKLYELPLSIKSAITEHMNTCRLP